MIKEWSNLAKVVYKRTYARNDFDKIENWEDTVNRVIQGNIRNHKVTKEEINQLRYFSLNRKASPAGRGLWFSGSPAHEKVGGKSLTNCWTTTAEEWENFIISQDLLMLGGGVGFSVEHRYTSKLPKVKKNVTITHQLTKDADFIIPDSREGWNDMTRRVLKSYFLTGKSFTYSTICIRGAGELIKGFGGKASGPGIFVDFVNKLNLILQDRAGKHIRPIDAADIMCSIGEMVVSGNVRRSAILILGDCWDKEYLKAKRWDLGVLPSYRAMANYSVVCDDTDDLHPLYWKTYEIGEPFGIVNRKNIQAYGRMGEKKKDTAYLVNPCAEMTGENLEGCNLQEIFLPNLKNEEEFILASKLMHRYGKRVSCEDFKHDGINEVVYRNRRIGTGITGCLQSSLFDSKILNNVYEEIQKENISYSKELKIPESIRTTVIKPSGCRPWNALTVTSNGILTLEDMFINHDENDKWGKVYEDIYATQENNLASKITKTYNNGLSEIHKIILKYNFELESTPNHKWFVSKKRITKPHKREFEEVNQWIETKDIKPGYVIESDFNNYNNLKDQQLNKFNSLSIKMRNDFYEIEQPDFVDEDLAWFLGYLWGDGAMSPTKYRVRFTDEHKFNLDKASKIIKEKFNLESNIMRASQNRNAYCLDIASKALWHWLIKNNIWKYFNDKSDLIPIIIRRSSKKSLIAFIAGLIDSDGCVFKERLGWKFQISTADSLLANHLQHVCWSLGLGFGKSLQTKGTSCQGRKHLYHLTSGKYIDGKSFTLLKNNCNKISRLNDTKWNFEYAGRQSDIPVVGEVISCGFDRKDYAYDIEVDKNHYYFDSIFKSHNTMSLVGETSPGIHASFSKYYIRRVRFAANDDLVPLLKSAGHSMEPVMKLDGSLDHNTLVVDFYCETPAGTPCVDDGFDTWKQLDTVLFAQKYWADQSVSATIYYKKDEITKIKEWLSNNLCNLKTISFLCYNDHGFKQAPLEAMTKEDFEKKSYKIKPITDDKIQGGDLENLECQGGVCPVK